LAYGISVLPDVHSRSLLAVTSCALHPPHLDHHTPLFIALGAAEEAIARTINVGAVGPEDPLIEQRRSLRLGHV
jgi:hypothetical protein